MKNKIISTWVYLDSEEEKSKYPNNSVKAASNSPEFQAIYWRCVIVFFKTSLLFHKEHKHILFTNTANLPLVNGFNIETFFQENNIEVVTVKNKYPLPNGYFNTFRNQFFEFSIIEELSKSIGDTDNFLMLDSDCIFRESCDFLFEKLDKNGMALTYVVNRDLKYSINGLNGYQLKELFNEFGISSTEPPYYSGGEVLLCSGKFVKKVAQDFPALFQQLITRFKNDELRFNEEAHVLSYFYYKYKALIGGLDEHIKRMWTNHNYYRNIDPKDVHRTIWHLPNEKGLGFERMFNAIVNNKFEFENHEDYVSYAENMMLNPKNHKTEYIKKIKQSLLRVATKIGVKK
ncbi:hypothetical protein [Maribacter sp. MAR_2009_72]|uniref:hypothetical protein n=1 Tax=Maribacter sp. MAR_2009_72 TaxID=1250050 RepID=UPI00119A1744|nr:hypothetical protein [Maribacter sp. MAR_2009_72]TVZ13841.1 hypothetical protein JM81_0036 [Maribacter sp. MAR_2009_72]